MPRLLHHISARYPTFKLTVDFPKQLVLDNIFLSPSKVKLKPFRDQNTSSRDRFSDRATTSSPNR